MSLLRSNSITALFACLVICLLVSPAQARLYSGSGTSEDPFIIDSAAKMNDIGNNQADWDNYFLLTANVDLADYTGSSFNMIGYYNSYYDRKPFNGVFDGNDHKIINFTYTATSDRKVGIFVYVDGGGEIKNLQVVEPNVSSTATQYCTTGSLVSYMRGGAVRNCSINGGSVSGYDDVGALVGYMYAGEVTQCRASDVEVQGEYNTGGLVGGNNYYAKISESYADCIVEGNSNIGGLIGMNRASVHDCYAGGNITGNWGIGGFIGAGSTGEGGEARVENCYSVSEINCVGGEGEGGSACGGFVGNSYPVVGCFWDIETSGQSTSGGGIGKTTAEMQDPNTFIDAEWDFDTPIWKVSDVPDYPYLWWEGPKVSILEPEEKSYITKSSVDIYVTFNRPVFGVDASDMFLSGDASVGATVNIPIDLGDNVWQFPITGLVDGTLDITLASEPNDIEDANGNDLEPAPTRWSYNVFVLTPTLHAEPEVTLGTSNLISWDEVNNAEMYYAQCSNEPNFASIWDSSGWIYNNSFDFNNLIMGETYCYRAKARTSPEILFWTQSTQEDFEADEQQNVSTEAVPGDAILALADVLRTETVGSGGDMFDSYRKFKGNFFQCTKSYVLTEIEQYLFCYRSETLQFAVYESMSKNGVYNRIHVNSTIAERGKKWYSSNPISLQLIAGRYYCIGVGHSSDVVHYKSNGNNLPISWGTKIGSCHEGYPPPSTVNFSSHYYAFYQRLTTLEELGHFPFGSIVSLPIDLINDGDWIELSFNITTPADTNLTVDVLDANDDSIIIADANVGDDISLIDVNSIKLRANLSTNGPDVTPALHDWSVTYTDPTTIIESDWSNVESSLQITLTDAVDLLLDPDSFKDPDMKQAFKDKISEVLIMIDEGLYKGALQRLIHDILKKTDGCANSGKPDKNDWIITCEAQKQIYPLIMETITYVRNLHLGQFLTQWLRAGPELDADLDNNGCVDFKDFSILANSWCGDCQQ